MISIKQLLENVKNCLINKKITKLCEYIVDIFGKDMITQSINFIIDEYTSYYITFNRITVDKITDLIKIVDQSNQLKKKKELLCNIRIVRIAVTQLFTILCTIERTETLFKYKLNKNQSILIDEQTPSFYHLQIANNFRTNNQDFISDIIGNVFMIKSKKIYDLISRFCYNVYIINNFENANIILSQLHNDKSLQDMITISHRLKISDIKILETIGSNCNFDDIPLYINLLLYICLNLTKSDIREQVVKNIIYLYLFDFKKQNINKRYNLLLHLFVISGSNSIEQTLIHSNNINPVVYECSLKINYIFNDKKEEYKKLSECIDEVKTKNIDTEIYEKALFSIPTINLESQRIAREHRTSNHNRYYDDTKSRIVMLPDDNKSKSKKSIYIVKNR